MLENQFYPTPPEVVERMISPWLRDYTDRRWKTKTIYLSSPPCRDDRILDPQAGNGAILSCLYEKFSHNSYRMKTKLLAVEIDPQLRTVLAGEGFQVIGTDWLEFSEPRKFGTILSNPPFAEGVDHFLKNLEYLKPGGRMACLLNAETIRNPYDTKRRFLLYKLCGLAGVIAPETILSKNPPQGVIDDVLNQLEKAGTIEFFGQCFKDAERTTGVEVVCIRIETPLLKKKPFVPDWEAGNFDRDRQPEKPGAFKANPLAHKSKIKTMVVRYDRAVEALQKKWELKREIDYYLSPLPAYAPGRNGMKSELEPEGSFSRDYRLLKALFWGHVFTETDIGSRVGTKAQEDFKRFAIDQAKLEFSERNIMEMLQMILATVDQAMDQLVTDVFDELIGRHHENKQFMEGWKTNSPNQIKRGKVIWPHCSGMYDPTFSTEWREWQIPSFLSDLDKAICWATGKPMESLKSDENETTIRATLAKHFKQVNEHGERHDLKIYSEFFEIRVFKKGTIHLKFLDGQIAKDFQAKAAAGRMWIGEEDKAA